MTVKIKHPHHNAKSFRTKYTAEMFVKRFRLTRYKIRKIERGFYIVVWR